MKEEERKGEGEVKEKEGMIEERGEGTSTESREGYSKQSLDEEPGGL